VTLPLLTPIIAVVMTFSVLFTFTDFQLIYVLTRGGPVNATHLMATLSFQRAIPGRPAGRGRGDRGRDDPLPAGGDPVQLLRPAAPQVATGGDEERAPAEATGTMPRPETGMTLPRRRARWSICLPLASSCSCCCSRSTGWRSPRSSPTTS
jgi:hypothetical protein